MSPGVVAALGAGPGPLVVAEVAQAHDGSLGTAHAYIDAVARTGADAVKFQTHLAHAESTRDEPWRGGFSPQGRGRYADRGRIGFTADQRAGLRRPASASAAGRSARAAREPSARSPAPAGAEIPAGTASGPAM
ncbi:MAG TPA: hypothetical protein PKA98_23695 [Acidimicrobiales bacterium]|nr:hypothetical protein [Acidimicrobiales bacterium]